MSLKVLSWNIWCGRYFKKVVDFLETVDADVIALQEVVEEVNEKTVKKIAEKLGYEYVSAIGMQMPKKDGGVINFGNAILSKHKIIGSKIHELSKESSRLAPQVDIQVGDKILHVLSVHLKHTHQKPSELQDEQAKNLVKVLPKERTVVMGDFNALPDSSVVKKVGGILHNAGGDLQSPTWSVYPEGCGFCSPQSVQYVLDYIFTTKEIKVQSFKVRRSRGSDHLPISATIEI